MIINKVSNIILYNEMTLFFWNDFKMPIYWEKVSSALYIYAIVCVTGVSIKFAVLLFGWIAFNKPCR